MKITYFFRHNELGYSIQKVFKTMIFSIQKKNTIEIFYMPTKRSMPWNLIGNVVYTYRNRNKHGINHITGHIHEIILGLIGCKVVLTVHDLVFIDNVSNPFKKFYKWLFWLYLPIKLSDKVVCISNTTKNNILKHVKTDTISVIYNAVDPEIKYVAKDFNQAKPIILHIGTGWNKNLESVIKSLDSVPCHLRIIGPLTTIQKQLLSSYSIEYSNVSNLTDVQIREEYKQCDIVSFPSLYEGFGMPIIEGQKTGRVVLTSYIEPLIEVANESVCYVDPHNVVSIKEGFLEIINNRDFRNEKIRLGKINMERFSVEKIADEYVTLYQSLM